MFSSIGDVLPRFRIFERLFSNHELLIQALSKVYVDIISFCAEVKKVFRDAQRATSESCNRTCQETHRLIALGSRIAFKLAWKPFERQFGGQIERFRQHRKNVEKEAGLAHMVEAADSRAVVLYNQMQLEADRQGQCIVLTAGIYGVFISFSERAPTAARVAVHCGLRSKTS